MDDVGARVATGIHSAVMAWEYLALAVWIWTARENDNGSLFLVSNTKKGTYLVYHVHVLADTGAEG